MFEGPGPTMNEVDTQFSILIANYLARSVILNFPPVLGKKRKKNRVGNTPERFFWETRKTPSNKYLAWLTTSPLSEEDFCREEKVFSPDSEVISPRSLSPTLTPASPHSRSPLPTFFYRNRVNFGEAEVISIFWPLNSGSRPLWPSRRQASTESIAGRAGEIRENTFACF